MELKGGVSIFFYHCPRLTDANGFDHSVVNLSMRRLGG
jgi:hypothetical protein